MSVRKFSTASILSPAYKNSKIWDGETFPGYFESIQTVVLSSQSSTIQFSNIPNNYSHLQIRGILRGAASKTLGYGYFTLTNSVSTNGTSHLLIANGSSANGVAYVTRQDQLSFTMPCATAASNTFGSIIIDILDYSNTNKNKTGRLIYGSDISGSGEAGIASTLHYQNTNAITDITFNGSWDMGNFVANSTLALYGIRSA